MKTLPRQFLIILPRAILAAVLATFLGSHAFAQTTARVGTTVVGSVPTLAIGSLGGLTTTPGLASTLSPMNLAAPALMLQAPILAASPIATMPSASIRGSKSPVGGMKTKQSETTSALDLVREMSSPKASGLSGVFFDGSPERTAAREELYRISNGDPQSGDPRKASITTAQRTEYFRSQVFRDWVAAEKKAGRHVFWLKDLDKTQARGDIFTFFFKWRADNGMITEQQNEIIKTYLKTVSVVDKNLKAELAKADTNDSKANAALVIKLWRSKEAGGEGIGLLDFWREIYWPTQKGLTREEKLAQVNAFAPDFASRIYPGVKEENLALRRAGVDVVLVSNGDQELARAVTPHLGIKLENAVGSHLIYKMVKGKKVSTGVNHAYEIFDKEWNTKPQPGKSLSFHYWLNTNKWRWGWKNIDLNRVVVAGADGDSASSDGGMMTLLPPGSALGNFMVNTPSEPGRLKNFQALAEKYGWTKGEFITLIQDPAAPGAWTDKD